MPGPYHTPLLRIKSYQFVQRDLLVLKIYSLRVLTIISKLLLRSSSKPQIFGPSSWATSNEQKVPNKEQKVASNELKVTSNKQNVTSNEQKVPSNGQRAETLVSSYLYLTMTR